MGIACTENVRKIDSMSTFSHGAYTELNKLPSSTKSIDAVALLIWLGAELSDFLSAA